MVVRHQDVKQDHEPAGEAGAEQVRRQHAQQVLQASGTHGLGEGEEARAGRDPGRRCWRARPPALAGSHAQTLSGIARAPTCSVSAAAARSS